MKPAEKVQALIGEFTDDYLIVMLVDGETAVGVSDPQWAREILKSGQVEDAISEHEAYLRSIDPRGDVRRHHGPGKDGPPEPKKDDKKEN